MKTSPIGENAHEEETSLETVKMSIDASAVDHLMSNLTNLYSEPLTAVLREYSSNAFDSHVRAGINQPIEITLPSYESPVLVVRDFGVGMSKDEIANVYSRYGLSTKTSNNSEIGGFGLGCKSALAICDKFDIVSVKDGVKTTAYIKKNVRGVGVVHFVSETPTSDVNGVEIRIPILRQIDRLSESNLSTFFIGMQSGTVLINGKPVASSFDAEWQPIFSAGERIGAYKTRNDIRSKIVACVGGVSYSLNSFQNTEIRTIASQLNRYEVVLDIPIGSVDLTPSREELMQTEKTEKTLVSLLSDFRDGIAHSVALKIDAASNYREASEVLYAEIASGYWMNECSYRGTLLSAHIEVQNVIAITRDAKDKRKTAYIAPAKSIMLPDGFNLKSPAAGYFYKGSLDRVFIKGELSKVDEVSKNAYYYFMSKYGTGEVRAFLFEDASTFHPAVKEMVQNAISIDEVLRVASEFKSETRKAALAATKAAKATGTVVVKSTTLPVWDVDDKSNKIKPMNTELITSKPIVYVHANQSSVKLTRIMPALGYQYENGGVSLYDNNQQTVSLMRDALAGYHVIFLSSQRNLEKFVAAFPQVEPAEKVMQSYLNENYKERELLLAHLIFASSNPYYSSSSNSGVIQISKLLKDNGVFQDIVNDDVKALMSNTESYHNIYEKANNRLIAAWVKIDQSIADEANAIKESQKVFLDSLVLATDLRHTNKEYAEHLVRYINMLYPA